MEFRPSIDAKRLEILTSRPALSTLPLFSRWPKFLATIASLSVPSCVIRCISLLRRCAGYQFRRQGDGGGGPAVDNLQEEVDHFGADSCEGFIDAELLVVSTPYWHTAELLADDRGILVPFSDPGALARAIDDLLSDENRRQTMRKNAYRIGRKMVWSNVAQMYVRSFERARRKQCESRCQSQKACRILSLRSL